MSIINTQMSLVTGMATRNTTTIFEQIAEKIFNCAEVILIINSNLPTVPRLVNNFNEQKTEQNLLLFCHPDQTSEKIITKFVISINIS